MYDINVKNVKKGRGFYYIFLFMGALFIFIMGGIVVSSYITINSMDASVLSTGVEINSYIDDEGTKMYSPVYSYRVDGVNYTCSSNSSSNIYPGEENVIVYYDSKEPNRCITEYSTSGNWIIMLFMIIPLVFIIVAVVNIRKVNKRVKAILDLNQYGKLVKKLPYHMENTGMSVNDVPVQRPVINYTLSSGSQIKLYGDPRFDKKVSDADGFVDLVIDESNPDNYFIDFEINRLSGNVESDYYNLPGTTPKEEVVSDPYKTNYNDYSGYDDMYKSTNDQYN